MTENLSIVTPRLGVKNNVMPKERVPLAKLSPDGKTVEGFIQAVLYFPI
jgi:hypothetical protein